MKKVARFHKISAFHAYFHGLTLWHFRQSNMPIDRLFLYLQVKHFRYLFFQDIKEDLDSVGYALSLIREDIDKAVENTQNVSTRYLIEKHADTVKYCERLVNLANQMQTKLEEKALGNQTSFEANLRGCDEWMKELNVLLNDDDELYHDAKTTEEQLRKLKVIFGSVTFMYITFMMLVLFLMYMSEYIHVNIHTNEPVSLCRQLKWFLYS